MELKDKITTKEDLVATLANDLAYCEFVEYYRTLKDMYGIEPAWWAVREEARIKTGVYQTTDALEKVNKHAKVFAHVSLTDRTRVAFTPDKAFGERDAQLTMNFGKMVQRVIPFASDEYVKQLTEAHNADLSDEVEWITGPEIADVYARTGVTSCMANKKWKFYNPALAYDAPGIKMAVLRDAEGSINARCMVYEDGEDKRLIRNYGDGKLLKRLTRLGYKPGGWQGVKFRTLVEHIRGDDQLKVAIPYLDCLNGPTRQAECTVVLLDGVLRGVESKYSEFLANAGVQTTVPSISGFVFLKPASSADFIKKDIVTGEELDLLSDEIAPVLYKGAQGVTKRENVADFVKASKLVNGSWSSMYMPVNEVFEHGHKDLFDGQEERRYYGYTKLSRIYYDTDDWYVGATVSVGEVDGVYQLIKVQDAVRLYDGVTFHHLHHSKIEKKAHTRVASFEGQEWYVTSNVEILRTPSKAKVVKGIHDIALGWNGWDYTRNLQVRLPVFNKLVYTRRAEFRTPTFRAYIETYIKQEIESYVAKNPNTSLQNCFADLSNYQVNTGNVYPSRENKYYTQRTYGISCARSMNLNTFKEFVRDFTSIYVSSSDSGLVLKVLVQWVQTCIAEMEAVNGEEPTQQQPTSETPELVIADRSAMAA